MENLQKIVVIGGGYAGMLAAVRAARRSRGRAEVTLVSAGATFVERVRLHQVATRQRPREWSIARLLAPSGARFVDAPSSV
jgi:NADH dehydrogenase FAD-containing subunit